MTTLDHELSAETATLRRWRDLKTQIKNLDEQAEAILKTEIEPAMEDGVLYDDGEMCLVFEFSQTPKFDAARALKEGSITQEVLDRYTSVTVVRKTMYRKRDEDGKLAEQQKLAALKAVADQFKGGKR